MRKLFFTVMFLAIMSLPLAALSATWSYYDTFDDTSYLWNLPADNDFYAQAFDPADFSYTGSYTITKVGIWATGLYLGESGSGNIMIFLILLPDKDTSPDGISHTYEETGLTLTWPADDFTLNEYDVDWDVSTDGQCVGLGVKGESPYISTYIIPCDLGPDDTNDWEYYLDGWYSLEDDFGYAIDFCFELTVGDTAIQPTSVGYVKALFQ